MSAAARLCALYSLFAAIATGVNLSCQWAAMRLWAILLGRLGPPVFSTIVALVCGTGAGLIVKYGLDKRYIFRDRTTGARAHASKFSLYVVMGLATTVIFWGAELIANHIQPGGPLVYLGGAIGLAIGYVVKYQLDKRFVFGSGA